MASPAAATFCFCKSFWSVLRSQALDPSPEPVEPDLALHQGVLEPSSLQDPVELHLALRQSLPDLLRNLLRSPVEPNLVSELCEQPGDSMQGTQLHYELHLTCVTELHQKAPEPRLQHPT